MKTLTCATRGLAVPFCGWLGSVLLAGSAAGEGGGSWRTLAAMPSARQEVSAAVLNGKIYVIAGYDSDGASTATVEAYNPHTNTWSPVRPLPFANNHNNAAVAGGRLYTFGGISNQAFVYDAAADAWLPVAPMHFQRGGTAAVGVISDKIYVAGGTQGSTSLRALEVYDPATNVWSQLAPMSVARNHTAGAVIDGKLYVVGGRGAAGAATALEVYNPQTNSWATRAPMPTGRSGIAAAAVNGELWVFGGEASFTGAVEVYNPAANAWRKLPNMPVPRHGLWAAVIGDRIHLAGGGAQEGFGASNANDVFTVERKATLANIASRLKVEPGDNALIAGFIVTGTASKRIIVRALGPSLPVEGRLADPVVELFDRQGQIVAANDNWRDAPNRQEISESTLAPAADAEAAILTQVAPGDHTAVVRGTNDSTGVGLVEVYDLEAGSDSQLANISTRALVRTGENVLIGGIILTGTEPRRVVVRAIGPSLMVPNALQNPTLALHDANGAVIGENDNWRSSQEGEIIATNVPPSHDLESAIVRTLPAANYTAIVRGAGESSGVGLVEAYALD
ncbi:MAG: hypothetical protein AVDCRST_MAG42-3235 [uncultured Chthoniobacterales bacterium]|uniref:Uncharacterized protein n=1 Tax=uncultured Chthoniobacterales bacterium TaxID=1836801 RepID=A0A6J4J956_9BACT|nr:MAG: hypothetical protein AVDCRST_MAG42-3235 [uncultured Chthoniobacterales bacterium]